jgi:hypothetical protein
MQNFVLGLDIKSIGEMVFGKKGDPNFYAQMKTEQKRLDQTFTQLQRVMEKLTDTIKKDDNLKKVVSKDFEKTVRDKLMQEGIKSGIYKEGALGRGQKRELTIKVNKIVSESLEAIVDKQFHGQEINNDLLKELVKQFEVSRMFEKGEISTKDFSKLSIEEQGRLVRKIEDFTEQIVKNQKEFQDVAKSVSGLKAEREYRLESGNWVDSVADWGGRNFMSIGRTAVLIKTVLGAPFIASIATMTKNLNEIQKLSETTGFFSNKLLDDFVQLSKVSSALSISNDRMFTDTITQFKIAVDLRRNFGVTETYSARTLDNIGNLANVIGLSNEEAVKFLRTLSNINGRTSEINTELIKSIAIMSNRNNVAFTDVMADITGNAEFFAKYMADSELDMTRSILKARQLGFEFGVFAKMFDGLTNVDTIIEKQSKLSMFVGRQIDLVTTATHQFHGETELAMESMLSQLSKISEAQFNMPFIKGVMAEQLGVSVQELNRMYRLANGVGDALSTLRIDNQFTDEIQRFNETFSARGIGMLKNALSQYILIPFNNFVSQNTEYMDSIFQGMAGILKFAGGIMKGFLNVSKVLGSWGTILVGVGGGIATLVTISRLFEGKKLAVLLDINNNLRRFLVQQNVADVTLPSTGYGAGTKAMGVASALSLAVPAILASYQMGKSDKETGNVSGLFGALLSGGASGALTGAMYGKIGGGVGVGMGALIGGGIGAVTSALSYGAGRQMNQGGILINKPTRIGNTVLGDGQNGTQNEAVIPLSSDRGKSMLHINLSDESIEKLIRGFTKASVPININIKNNTDKENEYYSYLANRSTAFST